MSRISNLVARLQRVVALLRLTPFDTATPEGRSNERLRRMFISTATSAAAKAISISVALISIPLTLHYLGAERYGMWLTISSFIAMMSFADLGMGNGLLNRIAAANGQDDRAAIRGYISSGFAILSAIACALLLAFWASYFAVPWHALFNVKNPLATAEAGPAMAVFATCFALSIPASIVQKVQIGLQSSFVASLWQAFGSLLSLAGILVATHLKLGLPWLVLAYLGSPLVAAILNNFTFFQKQSDIAPALFAVSTDSALHTAKTGLLFLLLQVVAAVSYSSDPLIISHLLGPQAVPQYSVPERMFAIVGMVITMGLAPLWPAYGEAISRADHAWVARTFYRSLLIAVAAAAAGSFLIACLGPTLLHLWVGSTIHAAPALLIGLAIWKVIEAGGNSFAMFLNGAHVVRFQVAIASVTGIVILTLKFLLIQNFGIAGTVWATIIGFTIFTATPLAFRARSIMSANLQGAT